MTMTNCFRNNDGTVSVSFGRKSVIVPADVWAKIGDFIDTLTWGELSSMVAHATRGVDVYSSNSNKNNTNPNADRNWGCRK